MADVRQEFDKISSQTATGLPQSFLYSFHHLEPYKIAPHLPQGLSLGYIT